MEYLGAWGTLIHEKNLTSKISCQTPFKIIVFLTLSVCLFVCTSETQLYRSLSKKKTEQETRGMDWTGNDESGRD